MGYDTFQRNLYFLNLLWHRYSQHLLSSQEEECVVQICVPQSENEFEGKMTTSAAISSQVPETRGSPPAPAEVAGCLELPVCPSARTGEGANSRFPDVLVEPHFQDSNLALLFLKQITNYFLP